MGSGVETHGCKHEEKYREGKKTVSLYRRTGRCDQISLFLCDDASTLPNRQNIA